MRRPALAFLALLLALPAFASEDVIRKGFNVSEGGTLRISVDTGSVKVVTGGTGAAVEITRKSRGESGDRRFRDHEISVRQEGNDVVITGEHEKGWNFSWGRDEYRVQWNVRVPSRYNVDVRTSGGSIELADIHGTTLARTSGGSITTGRLNGESHLKTSGGSIEIAGGTASIEADTSGGSITVGDVTGPLDVHTSGGSIRIARAGGELKAHTSGGWIKIEDAAGSVDASTSGGSISAKFTRQPAGDSSLHTSGGSLTVQLAPSVAVDLDAKASGGGVDTDVPVTVVGSMSRGEVKGKINGGGPKLVLRTSGGGIDVGRL